MNEQRMQAYVNLIQQLLSCPDGQQNQILSDNRDLLDEGLVMAMQAMAQHFADNGQENTVRYLLSMAQQLAEALGMNTTPASYTTKDHENFLTTVLQTIQKSQGNLEIVYPLFQQNQGMLDETLGVILKQWGQETFKKVSPKQANGIAADIVYFGNLINQFPLGHKPDNMELGITAYQLALEVYTREDFPVQWAGIQNNLGYAYSDRIKEDRGENLERAIAAYQQALEVCTREAFPVDWAMTQNNLGNAYCERIKEDRGENLERAIAAYQLALELTLHCLKASGFLVHRDCLL